MPQESDTTLLLWNFSHQAIKLPAPLRGTTYYEAVTVLVTNYSRSVIPIFSPEQPSTLRTKCVVACEFDEVYRTNRDDIYKLLVDQVHRFRCFCQVAIRVVPRWLERSVVCPRFHFSFPLTRAPPAGSESYMDSLFRNFKAHMKLWSMHITVL